MTGQNSIYGLLKSTVLSVAVPYVMATSVTIGFIFMSDFPLFDELRYQSGDRPIGLPSLALLFLSSGFVFAVVESLFGIGLIHSNRLLSIIIITASLSASAFVGLFLLYPSTLPADYAIGLTLFYVLVVLSSITHSVVMYMAGMSIAEEQCFYVLGAMEATVEKSPSPPPPVAISPRPEPMPERRLRLLSGEDGDVLLDENGDQTSDNEMHQELGKAERRGGEEEDEEGLEEGEGLSIMEPSEPTERVTHPLTRFRRYGIVALSCAFIDIFILCAILKFKWTSDEPSVHLSKRHTVAVYLFVLQALLACTFLAILAICRPDKLPFIHWRVCSTADGLDCSGGVSFWQFITKKVELLGAILSSWITRRILFFVSVFQCSVFVVPIVFVALPSRQFETVPVIPGLLATSFCALMSGIFISKRVVHKPHIGGLTMAAGCILGVCAMPYEPIAAFAGLAILGAGTGVLFPTCNHLTIYSLNYLHLLRGKREDPMVVTTMHAIGTIMGSLLLFILLITASGGKSESGIDATYIAGGMIFPALLVVASLVIKGVNVSPAQNEAVLTSLANRYSGIEVADPVSPTGDRLRPLKKEGVLEFIHLCNLRPIQPDVPQFTPEASRLKVVMCGSKIPPFVPTLSNCHLIDRNPVIILRNGKLLVEKQDPRDCIKNWKEGNSCFLPTHAINIRCPKNLRMFKPPNGGSVEAGVSAVQAATAHFEKQSMRYQRVASTLPPIPEDAEVHRDPPRLPAVTLKFTRFRPPDRRLDL